MSRLRILMATRDEELMLTVNSSLPLSIPLAVQIRQCGKWRRAIQSIWTYLALLGK
jgi:hypothetical protein